MLKNVNVFTQIYVFGHRGEHNCLSSMFKIICPNILFYKDKIHVSMRWSIHMQDFWDLTFACPLRIHLPLSGDSASYFVQRIGNNKFV